MRGNPLHSGPSAAEARRASFLQRAAQSRLLLGLLLTSVFAVHLSVQQQGHDWGGDFSLYLIHARNLATGRAYADTGYLFAPEVPLHGTPTFPPGLPLLLAPAYAIFGLNYAVLKGLTTVCLVLSLLPIYALARRSLPAGMSLILVLFLGLNSTYLTMTDRIASDNLYLLTSFAALYLAALIYDRGWNRASPYFFGLVLGLLVGYCYVTRSIGASLIAGIGVYDLLKHRRPTRFLAAAATTFAAVAVCSNALLHNDSKFSVQFVLDPAVYARNVVEYVKASTYIWINGYSKIGRLLMWSVLSVVAGYGLFCRLRREIGLAECYAAFYMAILCLYWTANGRYLLPLFPLYAIWMLEGLRKVADRLPSGGGRLATRVVLAAMLIVDAGNLSATERRPIDDGVSNPSFGTVCQYIRANTASDAVFLFWNPRVLALYTERKSVRYPDWDPDQLWSFTSRMKAGYVVIFKSYEPDLVFLGGMVKRFSPRFRQVYENPEFQVFAVRRGDD